MSILGKVARYLGGARTVEVVKRTAPCPICDNRNVMIKVHLDSDGRAEMLVMECPTCGEIGHLYQMKHLGMRPEPRFQREYAEAFTGTYNPPKTRREV
jgi:hypothetical protein